MSSSLTVGTMETCKRCKKEYSTVWSVPDFLWEMVTEIKDGSGLLCVNCFDELACEKKITIYWEGSIVPWTE